MKKHYIFPLIAVATLAGLAFTRLSRSGIHSQAYYAAHIKSSSGAAAAHTGAPGEPTCTQCHAGTVQNGDAVNSLVMNDAEGNPVTEYLPDSTYTMNFDIANAAPRRGFQIVALAVTGNTQAGTMTGSSAGGTNKVTSGGRQYINHTSASNTFTSGWSFKWKAPSTNIGDVRFYIASNVTNGNGNEGGDVIYTSQHTFSRNALASLEEENKLTFQASGYYASQTNTLQLDIHSLASGQGFVNLVDMNGRSVYSQPLGDVTLGKNTEKVLLPLDIKNGIYFVHLFINNQSTTFKVFINK